MKKRFTLLFITSVFSFLIFTGCKKELLSGDEITSGINTTTSTEVQDNIIISDDFTAAAASLRDTYLDEHPVYNSFVDRLAASTPAPCDDNTAFFQWINGQLTGWDVNAFNFLNNLQLYIVPGYYSLYFENDQAMQYFGNSGEYNLPIEHTLKDLKRFWGINTDALIVSGWHGSTLADSNKVYQVYRQVYRLSETTARLYASYVAKKINSDARFRKGNHPIFSLNGFASRGSTTANIPPKIILGDGFFDDYAAIGLGDVAPQAILAHEFGHHIQYQYNLIPLVKTAESSRRTELMADAFSAYFLNHARGAAMQWKRVQEFLQAFFDIGDCAFTATDHHGTPAQRMAAAAWGYSLANDAQKQGIIYSVTDFDNMFEEALPEILNH